jgi:2,5-diamino-6-(ribosylamino)-4(3H)-pyrimidinone 5'-phosphate reductase
MNPFPRPHVLINVASTADGKIDSTQRKGAAISSTQDLARVDGLRAEVDAVMVGGHTLLAEDPRLTVKSRLLRARRLEQGRPENPAKVGIISLADLRPECKFLTSGPARRLIYTSLRTPAGKNQELRNAGAEVFVFGQERVDLEPVLGSLHEQGIQNLLVEGGGTLIAEFFRLGLADELMLYIAPIIFGGAQAPSLADGPGFNPLDPPRLKLVSVKQLDGEGGLFVHYQIKNEE